MIPASRAPLLLSLLLLLHHLPCCLCWQKWDYNTFATDAWRTTWGFQHGPRGRRGHTVVLHGTKLILFGGRDNEIQRKHVPKTYNIVNKEGLLEFETYDETPVKTAYNQSCKPIETCVPLDSPDPKTGETVTCTYSWDYGRDVSTMSQEDILLKEEQCGFVPVGLYYNDVWEYDLDCERDETAEGTNKGCVSTGWDVLHGGDRDGACKFMNGKSVCFTPSERWHHGAAMFDDNTMLIYGGFSHACQDYCDDMWSFDTRDNSWMEIYEAGLFNDDEAPGKRWRFSLLSGAAGASGVDQTMIFFGGHRLWHGFSADNSQNNFWENHDMYPEGGYLDDLWIYTKKLLGPDEPNPILSSSYGSWKKLEPIEECESSPGLSWASRNDISCQAQWPKARAGHAGIYDKQRAGFWIHGGFTAYYPYINTDGVGSGAGVQSLNQGGFTPYPTYPFYLDDLWFYHLERGDWIQYTYLGDEMPDRRTDHIMVLASKQGLNNDMMIMFGGYYNNQQYDDTWYFNISRTGNTGQWQRKTKFVHANWPETCTDDLQMDNDLTVIPGVNETCVLFDYPPDLLRAQEDMLQDGQVKTRRSEILPYHQQGDETNSNFIGQGMPYTYYGVWDDPVSRMIENIERALSEREDEDIPLKMVPNYLREGTPIAPFAATAPRQYARELLVKDILPAEYQNFTSIIDTANVSATIWEWCVTGKAQVWEGDGEGFFGRSAEDVIIEQPRRQRYGWDGCREENLDEKQELWVFPNSRSDLTGTFIEKYGLLMIYGGVGYLEKEEPSLEITYPTEVLDDMWAFNINDCNNGCSSHGYCKYGFCICDPGYYGLDCSNKTCPGSFCYYDDTNTQICNHCCYSGYEHSDLDTYLPDVKKVVCSRENTGSSNGLCDGFGTCQCQPPYIGEDCSIKDCKYNCSFNGYCSVEFPVSRCMCAKGYFGEYCQFQECLNNCSYPNGICDYSNGLCDCSMIYNPFENFREWAPWDGEDCSYLAAYNAAVGLGGGRVCNLVALLVFAITLVMAVDVLDFGGAVGGGGGGDDFNHHRR
jgi:hypothetical protein